MNNTTSHPLPTNDIEAIRKAQHEWRLQKRRELEAKARKKHFRLSTAAAAQAHHKFPHAIPSSATSNPSPHLTTSLYTPKPSNHSQITPISSQSVAQQVLRQTAIQQHTQLQQMHHTPQPVSAQHIRMQQLFPNPRDHPHPSIVASAALITTSPGVSIHPQTSTQLASARPVAPRPSPNDHLTVKNAVDAAAAAAAAAAASAASASAAVLASHLDDPASATKASEEAAAAAAAAAAHAAANAAPVDHQFVTVLPNVANTATSKSTQQVVDAAAAAAAAAAGAPTAPGTPALPTSAPLVGSPLDQAMSLKLEQLEAQRQWRVQKRRELALKRAKGATSKRGRKRTKLVQSVPTTQESTVNHTPMATAMPMTAISTSGHLQGFATTSVPFQTSAAASVGIPATQSLVMSSGMQSHLTSVQLGVQGEFLQGQPVETPITSGVNVVPTGASAVGSEEHISAEDAAAMYAQITGTGTGGRLPMDTSTTTALPLSSTGAELVDVDVVHGAEADVEGPDEASVDIAHVNNGAARTDASTDCADGALVTEHSSANEIAKATEAAAAEAAGVSENPEADHAQDTEMAHDEQGASVGEDGIESNRADDIDSAAQPATEEAQSIVDPAQELSRQEEDVGPQESLKDISIASQEHLRENVQDSEMVTEEGDIVGRENGNEATGEDEDGINEVSDKDAADSGVVRDDEENDEGNVPRDSDEVTEAKEDDEAEQDRFHEDGTEDIMNAAAWQSLDSINP